MARLSKRAAARKHLLHRLCSETVAGDRLRARSLRVEALENRSLLAGDALASIELVVVDSRGAPLTHVEVGDEFVLQGIVRDLRPDAAGVFAAYADVTFDAAIASATAPLVGTAAFSGGERGDFISEGHYSEVGGFRSEDRFGEGAGAAGEVFFSIPLIADAAGELLIAANPADSLPAHDVLLFGINEYIAQDKIEYGFVRLQIGDPTEAPPSPWRNPANPSDVNNDGVVNASDVQQLQAELDLRAGQTSLDPAQAGQAPYFDVTGDGLVTPADLAAVASQLPAARTAPTVPGDDPAPTPGGDPAPEEPNTFDRLLDNMRSWLDMDWQVELRVTNGLTLDPVTEARVGDIVHVYAILRAPEEAYSGEIEFLPFLYNRFIPAFTRTALAYDPTKLGLVDSRSNGNEAKIRVYNLGPSPTGAEMLEAMKGPRGEHWLGGASFVVLEPGSALFSTMPQGTQPADGFASVSSRVGDDDDALRIGGSRAALQEIAEQLNSKVQHTAATVNLSAAGTRPTAQNDTYDLTTYKGDLEVDAEHGVLANDAAAAGSKVLLVQPAAHGTVTLNPDGSFRYGYGFERMQFMSDTFAYVVVNADGTSEFTEVEMLADKVPPLAEVRLRAVNANGNPLEHVEAGQPFFLQAIVTDLRPDGVGSLPNARGASDVRIDLSFDSNAIQVIGEVAIDSDFDGSTKTHTKVWAKVGPGDIRVRGVSDTGPRKGELEIFRVPVVAIASGTAEVSFDEARITLRPNLLNIPERLVQIQGLSLEVRENSRLWSNRVRPLDVTGDGHIAPADALEIVNYLNARGSGPVPTSNTLTASTSARRVYLDTDADNFVAPGDALAVINYLNAGQIGGEGESTSPPTAPNTEPSGATEADLLTLLASDVAAESRRRR